PKNREFSPESPVASATLGESHTHNTWRQALTVSSQVTSSELQRVRSSATLASALYAVAGATLSVRCASLQRSYSRPREFTRLGHSRPTPPRLPCPLSSPSGFITPARRPKLRAELLSEQWAPPTAAGIPASLRCPRASIPRLARPPPSRHCLRDRLGSWWRSRRIHGSHAERELSGRQDHLPRWTGRQTSYHPRRRHRYSLAP